MTFAYFSIFEAARMRLGLVVASVGRNSLIAESRDEDNHKTVSLKSDKQEIIDVTKVPSLEITSALPGYAHSTFTFKISRISDNRRDSL